MQTASLLAVATSLRASRLFGRLDEARIADLARSAVRRRHTRGQLIWRAGTAADHFTLIASGLVKIVRTAADGHAAIVAIFGPRETIGDAAVLARGTYPADAVAASDAVETLLVDATAVLDQMNRDPALAASMNEALLEHTHALQEKIRIMTAGAIPKRLATLLLHLASRFGDEAEDGTTFIPVALSRAELADLIGATMETTIRTISGWQKEGLVETSAEGFRLRDPAQLGALAAE